ncbi:MAG: O-methyltransferase, partial [Nanobdellota archaeon]
KKQTPSLIYMNNKLIKKRLEELETKDHSIKVKHLHRRDWPMELIRNKTLLWQIPRSTGQLLNILIRTRQPKRVLELGTSGGYSTLWMVEALKNNARIDTIEISDYRYHIAKESFEQTKTTDTITQHHGKTTELLSRWKTPIDFLFIDHGKEHYLSDFKKIERLLESQAMIVADNILDNPKKVKDFTSYFENNSSYETEIISVDNGILIAIKK